MMSVCTFIFKFASVLLRCIVVGGHGHVVHVHCDCWDGLTHARALTDFLIIHHHHYWKLLSPESLFGDCLRHCGWCSNVCCEKWEDCVLYYVRIKYFWRLSLVALRTVLWFQRFLSGDFCQRSFPYASRISYLIPSTICSKFLQKFLLVIVRN